MYLFSRKIEPCCAYCASGKEMGSGEIACIKRGIVSAGGFCKKFKYEPTKRTPQQAPGLKAYEFTEGDFTL